MAILGPKGTLTYNDFAFPASTWTERIEIKPVYDSANRNVTGNRYSLQFRAKIIAETDAANDTTDDEIEDIRNRLTQPGRPFEYSSKGPGSLVIQTDGNRDLAWGPKPELLSLTPVAGNKAWEIIWSVSLQTLDCERGVDYNGLREYCFRVDYNHAKDRLTTRTITGHIVIPLSTPPGSSKLVVADDTVDKYYDKVIPLIPDGFQRTSENRTVSEDRTRLDFTFVEEQLKHPLPPGCIDFDLDHAVNTNGLVWTTWNGTISGRYEVAVGTPLLIAQQHFLAVLKDRAEEIQREAIANNGTKRQGIFVPLSFSARVSPTNRTATFTVGYQVTTSLPSIMTAGMWRAVPLTNHKLWALSVSNVMKPRGWSQLKFLPSDDVILDLCAPAKPRQRKPLTNPVDENGRPIPNRGSALCRGRNPDDTWLRFENSVRLEFDANTVFHQPLPTSERQMEAQLNPVFKPSRGISGSAGAGVGGESNAQTGTNVATTIGQDAGVEILKSSTDPLVQKRADSNYWVILTGKAERICYEIPAPTIYTFAGRGVIRQDRPGIEFFEHKLIGNSGGPIYAARWQLRFFVPGPRETKPTMNVENPVIPRTTTTVEPTTDQQAGFGFKPSN